MIRTKIGRLAEDPAHAAQVRPIKGIEGVLRLRVGDWRVLYQIEQVRLTVLDVLPRGSAYR